MQEPLLVLGIHLGKMLHVGQIHLDIATYLVDGIRSGQMSNDTRRTGPGGSLIRGRARSLSLSYHSFDHFSNITARLFQDFLQIRNAFFRLARNGPGNQDPLHIHWKLS